MGARNKELKAFTATWVVCEAGSRGQKSSLERTTAVSVILHAPGINSVFSEEKLWGFETDYLHQQRKFCVIAQRIVRTRLVAITHLNDLGASKHSYEEPVAIALGTKKIFRSATTVCCKRSNTTMSFRHMASA
jgi:hypothetical protein